MTISLRTKNTFLDLRESREDESEPMKQRYATCPESPWLGMGFGLEEEEVRGGGEGGEGTNR